MKHAAPLNRLIDVSDSDLTNSVLLSPTSLFPPSILLFSPLSARLNACSISPLRTQRCSTPLPAQGGARLKRRPTMRTQTSMRTCPRPSWLLATLPSLPPLPLPLPLPLRVTTKPLSIKSPLSSSLLMLKLKTPLR